MPQSRSETPPLTLPTIDDVRAARTRLGPHAVVTPLLEHPALNVMTGARVLLKAENLQRVGAFKFRGAYNKIAQVDPVAYPGGIVACSSGNHAQGVAAAATICGFPSTIVMPADAPAMKIARTKAFGGEVITYDRIREDRVAIAEALCAERNAILVHPYDDFEVIAGQGTVGLELMEQAAAVGALPDVVLAPASGGGLASGISLAAKDAKPDCEVYCVEPAGFDDFAQSLATGFRQSVPATGASICDALLMTTPGERPFAIAKRTFAGGLVVTDNEASAALRFAFSQLKLVLEPGGAVALAAVLTGKLPLKGRTIAVVLSGGNVDAATFSDIIAGS